MLLKELKEDCARNGEEVYCEYDKRYTSNTCWEDLLTGEEEVTDYFLLDSSDFQSEYAWDMSVEDVEAAWGDKIVVAKIKPLD